MRLPSEDAARRLLPRCLLSHAIYELWGIASDYESLHTTIKAQTSHLWPQYHDNSFSFQIDSFQGKRSSTAKNAIIDSFSYVGFVGPIVMTDPAQAFVVLEEFPHHKSTQPRRVALGRLIATSGRSAINTYDLKKRTYISTTSMDAELALVTANMALAAPGKLMFDPFMGTGSFPVACAHFGATVLGADIDGRSIRGKGGDKSVVGNFRQYGSQARYLDGFVSDLTNSPLRGCVQGSGKGRWLDGVVCDPPYGVREGLKVLGSLREDLKKEIRLADGTLAHLYVSFSYFSTPFNPAFPLHTHHTQVS